MDCWRSCLRPFQRSFNQNPDWPCIQSLVTEVSPAIVWAGYDLSTLNDEWRTNPEIVPLIDALVQDRTDVDEAHELIAEFSEKQSSSDKNRNLAALFLGAWEQMNQKRKGYINKIIRYARHQRDIAIQVEDLLNRLDEISNNPVQDSESKSAELLETVQWHQRVYDQRERAVPLLCEQPVLLEEKIR